MHKITHISEGFTKKAIKNHSLNTHISMEKAIPNWQKLHLFTMGFTKKTTQNNTQKATTDGQKNTQKQLLKTTRDMGKLLMIVLHLLTICLKQLP